MCLCFCLFLLLNDLLIYSGYYRFFLNVMVVVYAVDTASAVDTSENDENSVKKR